MYQQTLRRFAHFNAIQLSDPAPLSELILLALKEEDLDPGNDTKDDLKERIAEVSSAFCIVFCYWFCTIPSFYQLLSSTVTNS